MRHLTLAFRTLFKTPFVTGIAVVSLALGIGANAAIFSLFDQILLRPLPVPEPDQLVNLAAPGPKPGSQWCGQAGDCDEIFSYSMFRDLERTQTVFTGLAAHLAFGVSLSYRDQATTGDGMYVSVLLPDPRPAPGPGTPPPASRRSEHRHERRHGARVRLLAVTFRERSRGPGAPPPRQWTDDDHRRRGSSGFSGDHARRPTTGVRADHHEGRARARLPGL